MENGHDLLKLICYSEELETDEEHLDYSGFRLFVLRKGSVVVSVATIRVFGNIFAEIPFVATREKFRREGYCRRLISVGCSQGTLYPAN